MDTPSGDRLRLKDLIGRPPLTRSIPAGKLQRLAQAATLHGPVTVDMVVQTDASGRHWLEGGANVEASAQCQRCLEPVQNRVQAQFRLWLLHEKAEQRLKQGNLAALQENDVRLIVDGMIDIVALVEDELLLELPEQPCQEQACPRMPRLSFPADADSDRQGGSDELAQTQTGETRRPFAGLKDLMGDAAERLPDD